MTWYLEVLRKYAVFSGRARRKEYWFFLLFNLLIMFGLAFIDVAFGFYNEELGAGLLSGLYALAVLLPSLGVSIRRLHDTDRSGWWLLLLLVPLVGSIVLIIFFALDGTPGKNRFGDSPKAPA
jgi:uncharacterized membrane protein YhaH (DUF805 family)